MSTIDLKEWPEFRKGSLKLSKDLQTAVSKMDVVMASDISDTDKSAKAEVILNTYLPH